MGTPVGPNLDVRVEVHEPYEGWRTLRYCGANIVKARRMAHLLGIIRCQSRTYHAHTVRVISIIEDERSSR